MRAVVYKSTGSWYEVKGEDGRFYECRMKGRLRIEGIKSTNPVAVGDEVEFDFEDGKSGGGVIKKIHERRNYIVRKSVNLSKQTHVIAANVDRAFLVVTIKDPVTTTEFIDRFLVTCEAYSIECVIVINKSDIYNEDEILQAKILAGMYREIGYECIGVSAETGKNVDKLKEMMRGRTSLISGHSGVGKSSILNAIAPELNLKTGLISQAHNQGMHTTTFAQMFDLEFGGRIIDTPGIKGFGVVNMEADEIGDYFPEIFRIKGQCKYNNCMHTNEPECAVREAVERVEIYYSRYKSYLQMIEGEGDTYRQKDV